MVQLFISILFQILLFIALFLESFPLFGAIIPGGAILIFIAGMLSKVGEINIFISFVVCVCASFLADMVGYRIGYSKGEAWVDKYSKFILIRSSFIHAIAGKLNNHPKKALIFGKFNPATRSIIPLLIGIKKLPWANLVLISLMSSVIWVSVFFTLGFIFGKGVGTITLLGKISIIGTVIFFFLLYFIYLLRQAIRNSPNNKDVKKSHSKNKH